MSLYNPRHDSDQQDDYVYNNQGFQPHQDFDDAEEQGFQPRVQTQQDIFIFKNIDLPGIAKTQRIKKFIVSQQTKILLTETNKIYRWRIKIDAEFRLYELPDHTNQNFLSILSTKEKSLAVKNIYIDNKGYHCIITAEGGHNYYLNYRDSKIKHLKNLKANIKALGFHNCLSQTKSGDILFSVENGVICLYRIQLLQNGQVSEGSVLQLSIFVTSDIIHIEILRVTQRDHQNYAIIIFSTISSLYTITGTDDLELLLNSYRNQTEKIKEIPMPKGYQCLLSVCYSRIQKRPISVLWTNGNNLINFRIPDENETVNQNFLSRNQIFKFAKKVDLGDSKAYTMQQHPINIGITDFHYYILFQESITIMSTITQKIVMREEFRGSLVSDMAYEKNTGIYWIFSNRGVFKLDTSKESTDVWKLLLEEKKYKEAYKVCKTLNQNVSYVAGRYADDLFSKKNYEKAAIYFSQTSRTFEQIFLKYLQIKTDEAREGLQIYLLAWLDKLQLDQKSQRCLLISWLIELISYRLNIFDRQKHSGEEKKIKEADSKLRNKKKLLEDLIDKNLSIINQELIYLIMQSHGRIQNLINFADKKNNFEMIVMHYLSQQSYEKALEYLKNVKDSKVVDVVYKYAHIFFRFQTEKTVFLLTKTIRQFRPIKLMPGLMNIPDHKRVHGIQLLNYCIKELKTRQKSLHNILIFFYATSTKQKQNELIQLIKSGKLDFDLDFGLRLFKTHKMIEPQIMVYGKMYIYSEAVNLALENGKVDLAKEYADKPEYQDERKKLWIEIAVHYLVKKQKISEVIELTKQSKVVKIQDLLPFFNQNIKIENFKDQICDSLKSYSEEIMRLKKLMDSYSENAEQLKNELRMIKNRCIEIDSSHKCEECFKTLFNQQFYIFPCMHGFHRDCLYECVKIQPTFNKYKLEKLQSLNQDIKIIQDRAFRKNQQKRQIKQKQGGFSLMNALNIWKDKKQEEVGSVMVEREESELKVKKAEIDNILAAECVYCGPGVVDTITMTFDNENLKHSWKI